MPKTCLPEHLRTRHDDWIWILRWVPRSWTSFCGDPPNKLLGNEFETTIPWKGGVRTYPKPIPPPGQWSVNWPPYIAVTFKNRWTFRFGARWNDSPGEAYYTFPSFKIGRLPK